MLTGAAGLATAVRPQAVEHERVRDLTGELGMFLMTRLIPHLLPRFGPKPLAVSGSLAMIAGLAWLTQMETSSGYATAILGPMLLLGFVPLTPVIMSTVAPQDAGAASGVLQTMQETGASLGLAVLVTVFGTAARHAAAGAGSGPAVAQ